MTSDFDFATFLPSRWTNILSKFPLLGSEYEIVNLDNEFIKFIESDGIILDEDIISLRSSFDDFENDHFDFELESESSKLKPSELFSDIDQKIKKAIKSLGGCVVPKLNWTVPKVLNEVYFFLSNLQGFNMDICEYSKMYFCERSLSTS